MAVVADKRVLPAEWSPHGATMLTWPHAHSEWHYLLYRVEPAFVRMAREISRREHLVVSCWDDDHRRHVERLLRQGGCDMAATHLYTTPSNDVWARDHGPITVLDDGRPLLLDFRFNGWGQKYNAALDDHVTRRLHQAGAFGDVRRQKIDMVLEGGAIESDGAGTLLTTESCLLAGNRNPDLGRADIEHALMRTLGGERILWLTQGDVAGDDTDGHIDTLARLCATDTIAYTTCDEPGDIYHYAPLRAMQEELRALRTAHGRAYELVPLPLPSPKYDARGNRLPATYANFVIINGAVLVPTYEDPADEVAIERLAACFPEREIIGIDSLALIEQYGSLHCATMQLPDGVLK